MTEWGLFLQVMAELFGRLVLFGLTVIVILYGIGMWYESRKK